MLDPNKNILGQLPEETDREKLIKAGGVLFAAAMIAFAVGVGLLLAIRMFLLMFSFQQ